MELKNGGAILAVFVVLLVAVAVWIINSNAELMNQSITQIKSIDDYSDQQKNMIIKKLTKKLQIAEKEIAALKSSGSAVQ